MSVIFESVKAARDSLKKNGFFFGKVGLKKDNETRGWVHAKAPHDEDLLLDCYAHIAHFLCTPEPFQTALEAVSDQMWDYYRNMPALTRNKFTRAMGLVAVNRGFVFQENLAADTSKRLIGLGSPIGAKLIAGDNFIGHLLRNKLFWKDSMDVNHGEHSHSLQWLAIAQHFNGSADLGTLTVADLYALTADVAAEAENKQIVRMWQWLADCFPTSLSSNAETLKDGKKIVSDSFRCPQHIMNYLLGKTTNRPLEGHFVSNYLYHRYRNRGWLVSDEPPVITKHYTGPDPKSYKQEQWTSQGWQTAYKPSGAVNPARLQRTPGTYSATRTDTKDYEQHRVRFHNKPGFMRFYTTLG